MGLLTQVSPVDLHLSYDGFRPYRARNALVGGPQRGRPALAQIMEISLARLDATEHVKGIAPGDRQINGEPDPCQQLQAGCINRPDRRLHPTSTSERQIGSCNMGAIHRRHSAYFRDVPVGHIRSPDVTYPSPLAFRSSVSSRSPVFDEKVGAKHAPDPPRPA
jgi:hypothetical protein